VARIIKLSGQRKVKEVENEKGTGTEGMNRKGAVVDAGDRVYIRFLSAKSEVCEVFARHTKSLQSFYTAVHKQLGLPLIALAETLHVPCARLITRMVTTLALGASWRVLLRTSEVSSESGSYGRDTNGETMKKPRFRTAAGRIKSSWVFMDVSVERHKERIGDLPARR
jgi:hypothetical protein